MSIDNLMTINDVRVSFPHLFTKPVFEGKLQKYSVKLLLDPVTDKSTIDRIQAEIDRLLKEKNKGRKLSAEKYCLKKAPGEGEEGYRSEHEGKMVLTATSKNRPFVVDAQRQPIHDEEESPIYGGCRVNARISLWFVQKAKFISCNLHAIQFHKDDEAFDGSHVDYDDAVSGFDVMSEEDAEFARGA